MTTTSASNDRGGPGPLTLGIDIGGTKMKACVLDRSGQVTCEPTVVSTPRPSPPPAILAAIADLVTRCVKFDRISIGFPGVVRGPEIYTAPNLGTPQWRGYHLADALQQTYGVPVRILNDAAVQGLGVVKGPGLETVITLGTGVGCAVFRDRNWLLHLELGLDDFVGNAVLERLGPAEWNERLAKVVRDVLRLTACERLYIGGGNARKLALDLPDNVERVDNSAGITGGVRLWEPALDAFYAPGAKA